MKKVLLPIESCIFVKGVILSLIVDTQRNKYFQVNPELIDFLQYYKRKTKAEIYKGFTSVDEITILDEYFLFLEDNDIIEWVSNYKNFSKLQTEYYCPMKVSNSIVYVSDNRIYSVSNVLSQILLLGCGHIEVRCGKADFFDFFRDYQQYFNEFISIDVYIEDQTLPDNFRELIPENVGLLVVQASDFNRVETVNGKTNVVWMKGKVFVKSCGQINRSGFFVNQEMVFESIRYNNCLNQKITIMENGDIKNCPSMPQSFGNIKDTTLEEALNHPDFKKYWNVKKDDITKCKDCEFRYICTDCRAYVDDPDDVYSAPLKCGYDPYTGEWEEWSTNPLKQKAIQFYGMEDLVKK